MKGHDIPARKDNMEKEYSWGTQVYPSKEGIDSGVLKRDDLGISFGYRDQLNLRMIKVIKYPNSSVWLYLSKYWTNNPAGWKG